MPIRKKKSRRGLSPIEHRLIPAEDLRTAFSTLIYGRSGTGKTHFIGTFPKPLLLIDTELEGSTTLAGSKGITIFKVITWEDLEQIYWYISENKEKYETVAIDQLTQLQDVVVGHTLEKLKKSHLARSDWIQVSALLRQWLIRFQELTRDGINIVFSAHEKSGDTGEAEEDQIEPYITARIMPSVETIITGSVSIIGNTFIKEIKRKRDSYQAYCLRVGPNQHYLTKIRKSSEEPPPPYIEDPTAQDLFDLID